MPICEPCRGVGGSYDHDEKVPCPVCDGKGWLGYDDPEGHAEAEDCEDCHGTGSVDGEQPVDEEACGVQTGA